MNEQNKIEDPFVLMGYSHSKKMYWLNAIGICIVVIVLSYYFNFIAFIPFLLVITNFFLEQWWKNRHFLILRPNNGLEWKKNLIPWEEIHHYSVWGPFGIRFTPIELKGMSIYLKKGKIFPINGRCVGYSFLLQNLSNQNFPLSSPWNHYPKEVLRTGRYLLAIAFSIIFSVIVFLQWLILVVAIIGGIYFLVQFWKKSRNSISPTLRDHYWVIALIILFLVGILYLLGKDYIVKLWYILVPFFAFVPVLAILWIPVSLPPLSLIENTLLVGPKRAYPLRGLKTSGMVSRYFFLKVWRLRFANGQVEIWPFLENFENFKKEIETQWEKIQKEQEENPLPNEVVPQSPTEEAKKIHAIPSMTF